MKCSKFLGLFMMYLISLNVYSNGTKPAEITDIISKEEFSQYKNVGDFIELSPKVTVIVAPELSDINQYGKGVVKSLTGSDCNRDGVMDDNATCNAVYLKLWLKYKR